MIEATKDLQTVGILFSPEDTDAIYQNEIFEAYLDQAGIPWKEYLIPAANMIGVQRQYIADDLAFLIHSSSILSFSFARAR